jgi:hypothetical protein
MQLLALRPPLVERDIRTADERHSGMVDVIIARGERLVNVSLIRR